MKENLSKKVLDKIKEEDLKPISKSSFLLKNSILWIFGGLTMILGAVAVSVIIFILTTQEWSIYKQIGDGFFKFFFLVVPYFWFVIFTLFIFITYLNYKHTKFGYRHSFGMVVLVYFLATLVLGGVFYFAKVGGKMENLFSQKVPFYEVMVQHRQKVWQYPERGLLGGRIEKILPNGFLLLDINKEKWIVDTKDAKIYSIQELKTGNVVGIVGKELSKSLFKADSVRIRGLRRSTLIQQSERK
ncbi:MAG: hypothetical protein L3J07_00430 [Candidatus Magasanikbacteria bacterium]|nr:hypothetical protein [Candidatus Magasanikbacteria bacterium]